MTDIHTLMVKVEQNQQYGTVDDKVNYTMGNGERGNDYLWVGITNTTISMLNFNGSNYYFNINPIMSRK